MIDLASLTQFELFFDLGIIIIIAAIFGYIAKFLRQPLIPAYLLTGLVIGPIGLGLIQDTEIIKGLSEIGIAFLLFIVGLEIDLKKLRSVSAISIFGGTLQVILTFLAGFFVGNYLGFNYLTSIYTGLIVAFSSTMIVIKLLSDKKELGTLHGRIILGILLIQDILVILALSVLDTIDHFSINILGLAIIKGFLLLLVIVLIARFLLKPLFKYAAKSQELLFISSLAFCFAFSFVAHLLGFSIAIGAFIAGVGLAGLPYNIEIISRITPLKDFFTTIFFVALGLQIVLVNITSILTPLTMLLILAVLIKPIIIMIIASLFGYEKRTSFLTSFSLGQISEFSLIIVLQGLLLNHISQEIFSITLVVLILSTLITSYFIKHNNGIYNKIANFLNLFERLSFTKKKTEFLSNKIKKSIVLFGCHRMGDIFLRRFDRDKKKLLVVDYNPDVISSLVSRGISCIYGDIANTDVLERIDFDKIEIAVSTIPSLDDNLHLIRYINSVNPKSLVFVTATHIHEALKLYKEGADYVIVPHISGGEKSSNILKKALKSKTSLTASRKEHLKVLKHLKDFGH